VINIDSALSLLRKHYGLGASLTPLDGDEDSNFLVETDNGGKTIFKIMHSGCDEGAVALPCAALQHLAAVAVTVPRVIPSLAGNAYESDCIEGEQRFIWLLSWCPGTLLVDFSPHSESVYRSFGSALAAIDNALQGFRHPAMHRHSRWQLTCALDSAHKVSDIKGETRNIARQILERFETIVRDKLPGLPHSVIHNDANDYNVLVNTSGAEAIVDGLFDFGDIAWQPVICEVAIALAYLIHGKEQPMQVCASFLRGYNAVHPLSEAELGVLFDLICTRLAVGVAISSHRQKLEPDNQYIINSQVSAKRAMQALANIDPEFAEKLFKQACGF